MSFGDRYYEFMLSADIHGAWAFLDSLADDERREAKAWFGRSRVALINQVYQDARDVQVPNGQEQPWAVAPWILALGPISLLGPTTAARKVPWARFWWSDNGAAQDFVVDRLREKDRSWVEVFVEEASAVRAGDSGYRLAVIIRTVATHHRLPCPSGQTFVEHWTAGVPQMAEHWDQATRKIVWEDPVGWLATDPFMPDLLFRHLASGECGRSPWLPGALATVAKEGACSRDDLIQHVLTQLTAPQRPASQKVLVEILAALELRVEEVAGGCAYFLGVIGTSKGVVGKLFVPMALETLRSADDLAELVAMIAGRSEKAQKTVLLTALKQQELCERVGIDAVRDSLELLASADDAAFAQKVRAVLRALPSVPTDLGGPGLDEPQPSGLWDLAPARLEFTEEGWYLATVLGAMSEGRFDADKELRRMTAELSGARLSMSTTTSLFRDLFLSGGLQQGYRLALGVAEAAAGLSTKPSGTAELIRLVAEFAPEIPRAERPELPPNLVAVATSGSSTKARAEARVLGARLAGMSADTYATDLRRHALGPSAPCRGLWKDAAAPTLAATPLPNELDPVTIGRLVGHLIPFWAQTEITGGHGIMHNSEPNVLDPGVALCGPDLLVSAVVAGVARIGIDRARSPFAHLPEVPRWAEREVTLLALAHWAEGKLDVDAFWRLALTARTAGEVQREFGGRENHWAASDREQLGERLLDSRSAVAYDRLGPHGESFGLVLTWALDDAAARLAFMRTLEVLLLSEENPVVLSSPRWADGTLDLDTLVSRLRAAEGKPIGPLDLVQALHRLRPCDPNRAREIEDLASSGGTWQTARSVTDPQGLDTWDALERVHTWVAAGGLPELDPYVTSEGGWATRANAPVPWSACAAAPTEARDEQWSLSPRSGPAAGARMHPLWPDRLVPFPGWWRHASAPHTFPAEMSGTFELPLHGALVDLLVRGIESRDAGCLAAARRAVRRAKVDRDLFVQAVLAQAAKGGLNVGRLAQATQYLFEQECLAQFWEPALYATDALVALPGPTLRGLPQLVEVLSAYVHEVPEVFVPPGIRKVAEASGRSSLHRAVVALVSAMDEGPSR